MARYTVHVPKTETSQQGALERAVFVREGWSWGAFIFGPLWLFWHRHWVFALVVLVLYALLLAGIDALPLHPNASAFAHILLSLLFGLEGASLRRFALAKAGYAEVALVAGESLDEMERRFFAATASNARAVSPSGIPLVSGPNISGFGAPATGVIGLFPEARLK